MERGRFVYFDSFVVNERIYCDSGAFVVGGIGLFPKLCSPGCGQDCESSVGDHGGSCYGCKFGAILVSLGSYREHKRRHSVNAITTHQYTTNETNFQSSWQNVKDH
jgi:hypothetical protein